MKRRLLILLSGMALLALASGQMLSGHHSSTSVYDRKISRCKD